MYSMDEIKGMVLYTIDTGCGVPDIKEWFTKDTHHTYGKEITSQISEEQIEQAIKELLEEDIICDENEGEYPGCEYLKLNWYYEGCDRKFNMDEKYEFYFQSDK